MLDLFKYKTKQELDVLQAKVDSNFQNKIMRGVWVIGFIVPLIVASITPGNTTIVRMMLFYLSAIGFSSLILDRFKVISFHKLSLFTIINFNFLIGFLFWEAPFFFSTTSYWFFVALILTVIIVGIKVGFLTLIYFLILVVCNHYAKYDIGLNLRPGWTVDQELRDSRWHLVWPTLQV